MSKAIRPARPDLAAVAMLEAFLRDVWWAPAGDDGPALIFADWLDERGPTPVVLDKLPNWMQAAACIQALLDRNNRGYRDQAESERFHDDIEKAAAALADVAARWHCRPW
jgi:uncharacterized protein (TIGR02996 family)